MNSLSNTAKQLHRHYGTLITGDVHPVGHPVAKGDAREHGWRELFRRFLPNCYGVKSGFIIDASGNLSEQIDCIIYSKDMGIELYSVGHHTVIAIEAVLGAFEVKPLIEGKTLKYARDKAISISKLSVSNLLNDDSTPETPMDNLSTHLASGSIIFGLLADSVSYKRKWKHVGFKKFLLQNNPQLSVFMTVEDGCSDTLDTGYPTQEYTHFDGDHALLNQLIRLIDGFARLGAARCLQPSCIIKYKDQLKQPTKVGI